MGTRLDRAMVERGLARSRGQAREMITAGQVRLNGAVVGRASASVRSDDQLDAAPDPYVSRGAHKLIGALQDLEISISGRALDAGSSTGGFTQVLLQRGCRPVYAVDVGTSQLAADLREDPRVVVREQTNLRELTLAHLDDEPVDVVVADLSFIPLRLVLDRLVSVSAPDADVIVLVKPQFEVGRHRLGKNGVVRDPALRRETVLAVAAVAGDLGRPAWRCVRSRHPGPSGNIEFFLWLRALGTDDRDQARDPLETVDFGR
jgi:23S rRNA (cytidine1920-2'-O)/16S rRNA (cytidine1409-2'-O)-methyltransferase